ncbi:MAG: radical SAM protein [Candidatus Entotheonella factor]|uniref:Radical SAM protein n=1 Tax=Entotheonella factor TaxID=1429438 RepID=W4L4M0_ENTF1|nr:MAG: radical SAM protein [Candidatus Entotheonella factor]
MHHTSKPRRGRGTPDNPKNRFTALEYIRDEDAGDEESSPQATEVFYDTTRSIIARNTSPDIGFDASVNPYRGCEHGCIYCYARPTHEYLGFSAGLDFETKLLAKMAAPALLRKELASPKWVPQVIAMSGVTDCYQPVERHLKLTRGCLEVLAEFRNPVCIITKNQLVTRDIDILNELARYEAVSVMLSITTLDDKLRRVLEPRASHPEHRLKAVKMLRDAGIPVGVMVAPIIAGLNDAEIPALVKAAVEAGAQRAGYTHLRLPYGVAPLFEQWLEAHVPTKKDKVLNRVRAMRGGQLNEREFGKRMRGEGVFAEQVASLFKLACRQAGLANTSPALSTDAFRRPSGPQLSLFD